MQQEQIMQIQMMEQEVNQLNEQLQLIDQNIEGMTELIQSLDEIKKGKEILTNLGKKVYLPVEIKDDKLIIEVGKGNFVKKSVSDAKKVIERETGKLMDGKGQIMGRLNDIQQEMQNIIMQIQEEYEKNNEKKKK